MTRDIQLMLENSQRVCVWSRDEAMNVSLLTKYEFVNPILVKIKEYDALRWFAIGGGKRDPCPTRHLNRCNEWDERRRERGDYSTEDELTLTNQEGVGWIHQRHCAVGSGKGG